MEEYAKHEIDYIKKYQDKGYTTNFLFQENRLIHTESKYKYHPEELYIVAQHRFEGMSNPEDMSILYVLETADAAKGTYLVGYGPAADLDAASFFNAIPEENCSDREEIKEV
ncbi:hypothetical protein [Flavobacterium crassostreae]|uniref:Phosphoribosylpyrophosphate synthetase n=1 Tax=Flavobacterium crassostreae TaxID=1763534 RepID=A0A1B9DYS3_9FLAO|nr:hypothetical protein [Flavobacterium crassostreae]OCB74830.1 hypothetical protein LPBF_09455 [Flavobacterium crassostreae]